MLHQTLAAISQDHLISTLVYLVVVGVIFWLLTWALGKMPIAEPFKTIINVIIVVVAVLICINVLLELTGRPLVKW